MEQKSYWNDAARWGAILGVILAVSAVFEIVITLSGRLPLYTLMTVEMVAVVALHYWMLHKAVKQQAALFSADEGYTFGQGYGYLLTISAFAGLIVGAAQYLYQNVILGYDVYKERLLEAVTSIISSQPIPAASEQIVTESLRAIETATAPSVFATIWGGVFNALLFGAIFGLIIAGVNARQPQPFNNTDNE